jgi:Rogdi leucine zipper containing protein.
VFGYCCNHSTIPYPDDKDRENLIEHAGSPAPGPQLTRTTSSTSSSTKGAPLSGTKKRWIDVYVREKVRVESADPSLMSLSAKLMALGHTLALARQNLEVLLGEDVRESSSEGSSPMEGGERGY